MVTESSLLTDILSAVRNFMCRLQGTRDDHNYSPVLHVLFDNVVKVTDQEVINLLWSMLEELQNIVDSSNVFPKRVKTWMDSLRPTDDVAVQTDTTVELSDSRLVQVTCNTNEFNRRISAFIKRKRLEADAFNRREFCRIQDDSKDASCARTDAIFVPRQSKKSILKIRRVRNVASVRKKASLNLDTMKNWPPLHPSTVIPYHRLPPDAKERLGNLQSMLNTNARLDEFSNVYAHMQELESRVLYLETLSPEYFHSGKPLVVDRQMMKTSVIASGSMRSEEIGEQAPDSGDNLALLDQRIDELKHKLRSKSRKLSEE